MNAMCISHPRVDVTSHYLVPPLVRAGWGVCFEALRFVRNGTVVVPGLLTTKSGELEERDVLMRRIDEAARDVPIEQLALSTQCGFASSLAGNLSSEAEQWRKLERVLRRGRRGLGVIRSRHPRDPRPRRAPGCVNSMMLPRLSVTNAMR